LLPFGELLKDVDNDAVMGTEQDPPLAIKGVWGCGPGGVDVLDAVAFYCRWQLETALLMQISISICCMN